MNIDKEIYVMHEEKDVVIYVETVNYSNPELQTDNHPGAPAEIEVLSYSVSADDGKDEITFFSDEISEAIFEKNEEYIQEQLIEAVGDQFEAEEDEAAVNRYEMQQDNY